MKKAFQRIAQVLFVLLMILPSVSAVAVEPSDLEFFKAHPALLDASALSFSVDKSVKKPGRARMGAFGIGGLNAFTLMGLSYPLNTYHNTTTYYHPFFGDSWVDVVQLSVPMEFPRESIWYVRGASIAVTREENDRLAMFTVNFSPPGSGALVRAVIIKALDDEKDLRLYSDIFGDKAAWADLAPADDRFFLGCPSMHSPVDNIPFLRDDKGIYQIRDSGPRTRILAMGSLDDLGEQIFIDGKRRVAIEIPEMKKGGEKVYYFYHEIGGIPGMTNWCEVHDMRKNKDKLLDETIRYWKDYLAGSTRIITPDERFNDMLEGLKMGLKIQRNASGAEGVTVKYADRSHDRENIHATRFYLAMGMPADAREVMMYNYYAAQAQGAILNSQLMDLDVSHLPATVDWDKMPLDDADPGRHVAERPSWTVLQFYRYYKQTGDIETIKKVYGYLRRNIVGQEISPEGLLPFSTDEMYQITFSSYISSGLQLKDMYSMDSSAAFAAPARGMEELAQKLGKPEDAALFAGMRARVQAAMDKYYWIPDPGFYAPALRKDTLAPFAKMFPPISLNPVSIGMDISGDEDKYRLNLINTIKELGQKDGSLKMAKGASLYHAYMQGEFLINLKHFHHPLGARMFDLMIHKMSDPAGTFTEVQSNDHQHLSLSTDPTGKGKEDARRFGPWETALNIFGLEYWLTGMSVDAEAMTVSLEPELPEGWKKWELRDGRVKNNRFDFYVNDSVDDGGDFLSYRFVNKGPEALKVSLALPVGERTVDRIVNAATGQVLAGTTMEKTDAGMLINGINESVEPGKEFDVRVFYK